MKNKIWSGIQIFFSPREFSEEQIVQPSSESLSTLHIVCSFELQFQPPPPCVLFPLRNYFSPRGIVRTQSSSLLVAGIHFEGPFLWRLQCPSLQE